MNNRVLFLFVISSALLIVSGCTRGDAVKENTTDQKEENSETANSTNPSLVKNRNKQTSNTKRKTSKPEIQEPKQQPPVTRQPVLKKPPITKQPVTKQPVTKQPAAAKKPPASNPSITTLIANGKNIFETKFCARCHAKNATGTNRGPNLTTGTWNHSDGSVEGLSKVIANGVPRNQIKDKKFRSQMNPGSSYLSQEQIEAVAAYLHTFHKKK